MSYDGVSRAYIEARQRLKSDAYVSKLVRRLRADSLVLDLGCGAGEPVDNIILNRGHRVLGIDLSNQLIEQARKLCPGGEYQVGDITKLYAHAYKVDAVVCLYTFFHLPRQSYGQILQTINSFLPLKGLLLISMGDKDFEGYADYLGKKMWWSQWGPAKNRELIEKAGFEIIWEDITRSGGEAHQMMLAEKVG